MKTKRPKAVSRVAKLMKWRMVADHPHPQSAVPVSTQNWLLKGCEAVAKMLGVVLPFAELAGSAGAPPW